jgi:hypothetical protein
VHIHRDICLLELLERLKSPIFFASMKSAAQVETAKKELSVLVPSAFAGLASKLMVEVAKMAVADAATTKKPVTTKPVSPARENYVAMARGMIAASGDARKSVWRYLDKLLEEPAATDDALAIISEDPTALVGAKPLTRERAVATVRRNLLAPVARKTLCTWISTHALTEVEENELSLACEALLIDHGDVPNFKALEETGLKSLVMRALGVLVDRSGSSTFAEANPAISLMQELPEETVQIASSETRAMYVLQVARSASGPYPAYSAVPILKKGLGDRKGFVDDLVKAIGASPDKIREVHTDWRKVADILIASDRADALPTLVGLFEGQADVPLSAKAMLLSLQASNAGGTSIKAGTILAALTK